MVGRVEWDEMVISDATLAGPDIPVVCESKGTYVQTVLGTKVRFFELPRDGLYVSCEPEVRHSFSASSG